MTSLPVHKKGSSRLGLFTCDVTSGCQSDTLTTCDYQTAGVNGRATGQLPRVLRSQENNRRYNASKLWFPKAKEFFWKIVRILLRQPRPKPIKLKEYQFQGAKLVRSPGRPRLGSVPDTSKYVHSGCSSSANVANALFPTRP